LIFCANRGLQIRPAGNLCRLICAKSPGYFARYSGDTRQTQKWVLPLQLSAVFAGALWRLQTKEVAFQQ